MPWQQRWVPAPKNKSLPVLKELPPGQQRVQDSWLGGAKTGYVNGEPYHWCDRCGGWIEGEANEYSVNTLNSSMLCGRRGKEYYCRRCGEEIGFMGMRS